MNVALISLLSFFPSTPVDITIAGRNPRCHHPSSRYRCQSPSCEPLRASAANDHLLRCTPTTAAVDSDSSSVHTTPSLRAHAPHTPKADADSHFHLDSTTQRPPQQQDEPASSADSPPPFSSHSFPSSYFPAPSPADPYKALVTAACAPEALTVLAEPSGPAPPFEETEPPAAPSSVVADTKAALPRDTKDGQSSKDLDDGEPPPPYTEGSSPLDGFTYVMAAAGGAASIITQVQQGGPAPINTAIGGGKLEASKPIRRGGLTVAPGSDENITLDLRFVPLLPGKAH